MLVLIERVGCRLFITCSVLFLFCFFFFFQAEDGIRDLVRSRGLGDVYKRQVFADMGASLLVVGNGLRLLRK